MTPVVPHFQLHEESPDARTHVISVRGEIHVSTASQFSERLNAAIEGGKTAVVLDLGGVEFIDSTGLSVLLNALRRVTRRDGRLALVCSNPTVLRLFEITRLDSTFDIFGERPAALAHVHAAGGGSDGASPDAAGSSGGAP
jgi:anti-sigma B factor antagonist